MWGRRGRIDGHLGQSHIGTMGIPNGPGAKPRRPVLKVSPGPFMDKFWVGRQQDERRGGEVPVLVPGTIGAAQFSQRE